VVMIIIIALWRSTCANPQMWPQSYVEADELLAQQNPKLQALLLTNI
jgi:hypothetical protein